MHLHISQFFRVSCIIDVIFFAFFRKKDNVYWSRYKCVFLRESAYTYPYQKFCVFMIHNITRICIYLTFKFKRHIFKSILLNPGLKVKG